MMKKEKIWNIVCIYIYMFVCLYFTGNICFGCDEMRARNTTRYEIILSVQMKATVQHSETVKLSAS